MTNITRNSIVADIGVEKPATGKGDKKPYLNPVTDNPIEFLGKELADEILQRYIKLNSRGFSNLADPDEPTAKELELFKGKWEQFSGQVITIAELNGEKAALEDAQLALAEEMNAAATRGEEVKSFVPKLTELAREIKSIKDQVAAKSNKTKKKT